MKTITSLSKLINIYYYPLAFIFYFTLKEVFKQGQELKQENDLTI